MKVKVAVLQYDCPEKPKDSLVKLEEMVAKAAKLGAQLIVAPETAVGEAMDSKKSGKDYLPELSAMATKNNVYLAKPEIEDLGVMPGSDLRVGKSKIGNC